MDLDATRARLALFLAVLALSRKALAVGAPLLPGLRMVSPDPLADPFSLSVNIYIETIFSCHQ